MFHSDIELQAWERLQGVPKKIDLSHGTHGSAEAPALLKVGNLSLPHAASDHICEQGVPILYAQWSFGLRFTYATPVPITCSCLKVSTKRLDRGPRAALVRALAAGRAERYRAGAAGADAAERGDSGARRRRGEYGLRVRVEIMGSQKCGIVGKSQPALIMINPMIFTRTRRATVVWLAGHARHSPATVSQRFRHPR
jgi:hypothetical protein